MKYSSWWITFDGRECNQLGIYDKLNAYVKRTAADETINGRGGYWALAWIMYWDVWDDLMQRMTVSENRNKVQWDEIEPEEEQKSILGSYLEIKSRY